MRSPTRRASATSHDDGRSAGSPTGWERRRGRRSRDPRRARRSRTTSADRLGRPRAAAPPRARASRARWRSTSSGRATTSVCPSAPVAVRSPRTIRCHGAVVPTIAPVLPPHEALVDELAELIAIPSVSADAERSGDVRAAAEWVAARIRAAGGTSEIEERSGRPLVVGHVSASTGNGAPTVLAYAHLDVQPPDPLELWESDPWTLVERDGKLVARGVADDKAHLFMLLKATELLAAAGELPVNVRFAIDAEEEVGGHSVVDWVGEDTGPADVGLVLDGGLRDRDAAELLHRAAGHLLLPRHRPHGRARPALRDGRRCRPGRDARAAGGALGGAPGARRAPPRAAAGRHRRADRRRRSPAGRRCRTGATSSPARAPARPTRAPRTSSWSARRRSRRSP